MQKIAAPNDLHALAWAELAELLELQLWPLGQRAIDALSPQPGEVILDVGCGTGQTVLQLAQLVGPAGRVIGVDLAPRLLAIAAARASDLSEASFIEADAATMPLAEGTVDGIFSRFGVMAFIDPVAALSNLHRMMKPNGRLAFVCWRALDENELDYVPLRAAGLEARVDSTPFSFEDVAHVRSVLADAGFRAISVRPDDVAVSSGDLDAMVRVVTRVGALGKILREAPDLLPECEPRVRAALCAHDDGTQVSLTAAIWTVSARA